MSKRPDTIEELQASLGTGARIKSVDGAAIERSYPTLVRPAKPRRKPNSRTAATGVISAGKVLRLEILLPIHLISEANAREHWTNKHKRNTEQQETVTAYWQQLARGIKIELPCKIRFTRIGVNALDSDNLAGAFKHVRDAIAKILGVDDGSEWLAFEYDQIAGQSENAIKIEFLISG